MNFIRYMIVWLSIFQEIWSEEPTTDISDITTPSTNHKDFVSLFTSWTFRTITKNYVFTPRPPSFPSAETTNAAPATTQTPPELYTHTLPPRPTDPILINPNPVEESRTAPPPQIYTAPPQTYAPPPPLEGYTAPPPQIYTAPPPLKGYTAPPPQIYTAPSQTKTSPPDSHESRGEHTGGVIHATRLDYQFTPSLPPDEDALKAYREICGNHYFCSRSTHLLDQPSDWTCHKCPPCSCDSDCDVFGTCCPDAAIAKANFTTPTLRTQLEQVELSRLPYDITAKQCRSKLAKSCENTEFIDRMSPYKAIMVARCPIGYNNTTIRELCEGADNFTDMERTFMVSSQSTAFTYRNIYCSRCHGLLDSDVEFWTPVIECKNATAVAHVRSKTELWQTVVEENSTCCITHSRPPSGIEVRNCWWSHDVIDRCNITGKWETYDSYVHDMCAQPFTAIVIYRGTTYKNLYCASCNGHLEPRRGDCVWHGVTQGTFSFAALIDFSPRAALAEAVPAEVVGASEDRCGLGEAMDPYTEACTHIKCDPRFQYNPTSQSCDPIFPSVRGLGYKITVRLVPVDGSIYIEPRQIAAYVAHHVEYAISPTRRTYLEPAIVVAELENPNATVIRGNEYNVTALHVSVEFRMSGHEKQSVVTPRLEEVLYKQSWKPYAWNGEWEFNVTRIDTCEYDYFLDIKDKVDSALYYSYHTPKVSRCSDDCSSSDYVDVANILLCPYLTFDVPKISYRIQGEGVNFTLGNYSVFSVDGIGHRICGSVVRICVSLLENATLLTEDEYDRLPRVIEDDSIANDQVLIILSIIATTVSLLGLLLTFVTYCLFSELRSLPGLNTMALIANLFVAQIVFQMGIKPTGYETVCRVLGIAIHYLWMTSFAWMAVCAVHMYHVFRNVLEATVDDGKSRFAVYIVIGNVLPAAIPTACVLYHHFSSGQFNFGYGGWICFLNTPQDIAYFFAVPLGVVLLLNVVFFTLTVMSLRKMPDMSSSSNHSNRGHMCIYIKMSALLGLTWVLGLIAAALGSTVVWYMFTIVNSSQGVFIFVAYCAKKRILKNYQILFYGKPQPGKSVSKSTGSTFVNGKPSVESEKPSLEPEKPSVEPEKPSGKTEKSSSAQIYLNANVDLSIE